MTVVEECAVCMKCFDETTRNLMVRKLLVAADPVQELNYTPSRAELRVNDVLAYIHGISCAEYQNILHDVLRCSYRVCVTDTSVPDLVVCLKCAAVLSKLYNTFKTFRQLTKARSINSRVYSYHSKNGRANDKSLGIQQQSDHSAARNSVHRPENSVVGTNSSNLDFLNINCSNYGIDETFGTKLEDEQPIFDLLSNEIGPYSHADPLQDPLGDFTTTTTSTSDQEQHGIGKIEKDVAYTENSGFLNSSDLPTYNNTPESKFKVEVDGGSSQDLKFKVEVDGGSSQDSVHPPACHVTDIIAPKPTTTTIYQYQVYDSNTNVIVSGSTPYKQIQEKTYLILKPLNQKNSALESRNGEQGTIKVPLDNSATVVNSKLVDSTINKELAIVNVRTLSEPKLPSTPPVVSSTGTLGKRKLPSSAKPKRSVPIPIKMKPSSSSSSSSTANLLQPSSSQKKVVKSTPPSVFFDKIIFCKICKKEFKTNFGLEAHMNVAHTVTL